MQWYVSEGLIPRPQHLGREAFFDRSVYDYVNIIVSLSSDPFGMDLDSIGGILRNAEQIYGVNSLAKVLTRFAEVYDKCWDQCGEIDPNTGYKRLGEEANAYVQETVTNIKKKLRGNW